MIARAKTSRSQKSVKLKKKAAKVAKPAKATGRSRAKPVRAAVRSKAKPAKAAVRSKAKPVKAAVRSKAKPAKTAVRSKAKPANAVVRSKAKPSRLARKNVVRPRAKKTAAPAKPVIGKPVVLRPAVGRPVVAKPVVQPVVQLVAQALDDMKAVDVTVLDVRNRTDITDTLIVASGTSDRHVRSIAQRVVENAKKAGFRPMGIEGEREGEWILVDLQDLILHIMLPRVREFYRLENLWDVSVAHRETVVIAS